MDHEIIVNLQNTIDSQAKKLVDLEGELAAERGDHLATMEVNEALQKRIEELELVPAAQTSKPAAPKVTKIPTSSFNVGQVDYVFTVPAFHFKGSKVTAEQALEDKKMLKELVELKVGFIKVLGS